MTSNWPAVRLGILGGGQLGRMSALAAARLGIHCVIYTPEADSPASQVVPETILTAYEDQSSLRRFAESCDFITYEFENIPLACVDFLDSLKPGCVFPRRNVLEVSQERVREKQFLNQNGIPTADWRAISSWEDLMKATKPQEFNDFIIKTTRFGYDGKGQYKSSASVLESDTGLKDFVDKHGASGLILEALVPFSSEISVIVARDMYKKTITYGPMLNDHKNHILDTTTYPAPLPLPLAARAQDMAVKLAQALDLRGVLTLEMFVCADGRLLANEIAPRTHNSGHWSIDACAVSQFENHVRAVCGLPVADPAPHASARMVNLIGADIETAHRYLKQTGACLHLYGKTESKEGRKMGHVTFLSPLIS